MGKLQSYRLKGRAQASQRIIYQKSRIGQEMGFDAGAPSYDPTLHPLPNDPFFLDQDIVHLDLPLTFAYPEDLMCPTPILSSP